MKIKELGYKVIFVATGHMTNPLATITYVTVVTKRQFILH